jgi:MoaA/NifB/PqqE/SkfB family radical SAM enzyme
MARRVHGRVTGRLESLPILALSVHSACNCRCVMCDIWKANAVKREIGLDDLRRHTAAIRRLHVGRVMLTGGEPLLHANLWGLCDLLRADGIRITLVTTGLLLDVHASHVARSIDEVVVSIDGPPAVHDTIRRVPGGFARVAKGVAALAEHGMRSGLIARSVVQKGNFTHLAATIARVRDIGVHRLSFLAADVSSAAFNRPTPWDQARRAEVALAASDLPAFADVIREVEVHCADELRSGFVAGGAASLWRLYDYSRAVAGEGPFRRVRCNAPWVSAVVEPDGQVRPCFFHEPYPRGENLEATLNGPGAVRFRRELDVARNDICRRCVCSLSLPIAARA